MALAQRSPATSAKVAAHTLDDGTPAHGLPVELLTTSAPKQQRALDLIDPEHRFTRRVRAIGLDFDMQMRAPVNSIPHHHCEAPRESRGFQGSPFAYGSISLRHRNVCRNLVTGTGVDLE